MKKVLFTLILSLALQSCDWIKSLGPEETFFCKINGQKFRPDKDDRSFGSGGSGPLSVSYDVKRKLLTIYCSNNPQFVGLAVYFKNTISKGTYVLDSNTETDLGIYSPKWNITNADFTYSESGVVVIDDVNDYHISGTFEFNTKSLQTGKEYRVTEGEFNKLSYY
ncbi:hypothetical protein LAG90_14920 [Marinilongibacter aquaticus]|uniref:DUF6252 family protein n=1 Tax=Marinilongibacter aquaticus TaxID=2975157 RepID=UPI0021BD7C7F|nr:DUF6252 family protein [Marinilongibacter aquaticus]UBM58096.1 hypothetical protein LAG90_14920 [Marinilongibacter aquaticus]